MVRAAAYARVSSSKQRDAHTIESQLRSLPAFIAAQGWQLVGTYVDDGRSAKAGKLDARGGFAKLLADAAAGAFDVVAVVDLDRLTRSEDITERGAVLGAFQRAHVKIAVSTSGQVLDLSSSMGDLFSGLQAFFAAEENRKRRERTISGKLRAIAEGRKPAGPTPFGLAYDRERGAWSVDPATSAVVREIARRVIGGESCESISLDLDARGAPSPRGPWRAEKVWRIAVSRHTAGQWIADKRRRLTVPVPAILDEATWQDVQDALACAGKRGLVRTRHVYLLEGLARCGACGSPIGIRSASRRAHLAAAYVCRARKLARRGEPRCTAPIVPVADLDARVWAVIAAELQGQDLAEAIAKKLAARAAERRDWAGDAAGYRSHLARLAKVEAGVLARFRRGTVSPEALDLELAAIGRERTAVAGQLATAERAIAKAAQDAPGGVETVVAALRALAASAAPEARQRVVRMLVAPGTVVLAGARARLAIAVDPAPAALALGRRPGSRNLHEGTRGIIRFRVVA